jgi:hypothetical protein
MAALMEEAKPPRPPTTPVGQHRPDQVIGIQEIRRMSVEVELREHDAEEADL